MDEESEKIMALKKVYAEIILNTAKEAAARIMASERKNLGYQRDLSFTKDEALRLLLRLKQTMDCKINEVEMKSKDQQRKIDELENQLQEAEEIVSNLRAELNEAHIKLDEFTDNQVFAESNVMVKSIDENRSLQPVIREAYNGAHGYSEELEVPSIIIKRKKPEMYQNRCDQRIRVCDRKILIKKARELLEEEEGERICVEGKCVDIKEDKGRQSNSPPTASCSVSEMGALQKVVFSLGDDGMLTKVRADGVDKDKETALDDDKVVDTSDELVSSPKDKLLKYTFQRKRKREPSEGDFSDILLDESPLRKRIAMKQNPIFKPVNCTQVKE